MYPTANQMEELKLKALEIEFLRMDRVYSLDFADGLQLSAFVLLCFQKITKDSSMSVVFIVLELFINSRANILD